MIRAWNRHLAPAASETLLVPSWRRILYWKIQHFALRLSPKISPNAACHEKWQSKFTKYCACHAKWISWLIRVSYETSFPMRRASKVNLEPHQMLRLPRKMNPMINPRHTWNFISNARSKHVNLHLKYCACHEILKIAAETLWIASANIKTIRG